MSKRLGPLELDCDSPPYTVVKACRRVDLRDPEDVRWCRMSHHVASAGGWRDFLGHQPWKSLLGLHAEVDRSCVCGGRLPLLERCTFTFNTGKQVGYLMGQCRRCRTIFWEQA
jgi:hypothetical protein